MSTGAVFASGVTQGSTNTAAPILLGMLVCCRLEPVSSAKLHGLCTGRRRLGAAKQPKRIVKRQPVCRICCSLACCPPHHCLKEHYLTGHTITCAASGAEGPLQGLFSLPQLWSAALHASLFRGTLNHTTALYTKLTWGTLDLNWTAPGGQWSQPAS